MNKKLRIVLADDHAVLRAGLKVLLNAEPDLEVIGEASDGEEAIDRVDDLHPDLVLLDLTMPKLNGVDCIEELLKKHADLKILVLTMHDDEEYLKAVLQVGAKGYVLKKAADVELLSAIRTVARGEMFIYPTMAAEFVYRHLVSPREPEKESKKLKQLSERELEVLRNLALGHTNQDIADLLHVSVKTVETYKARVMEKLEMHKRAELVRYAMENGII
ncbi:two component transcriptional regulator, LuxR family [Desulfitobacterium hafniense DCB-2]|uniref:Stage 0 sporulation protein A homolog n=1 Tax=Desulfitobacterium hafniense (strain DSM 10664 / DCB-2) TaxID=272564 RepID=B8G137_DESHD|nr:response regulator transcription factor [Desulfitobacterium hafniense]ACL19252.1 two component transcriptional regulator, LuxR family [Desulfitobacterium hafniense DCB-2]